MNDFPGRIRELEAYEGRFDAFQLEAAGCRVLFASYPAGTRIGEHSHDTDNVGVITRGELILVIDGRESRYGPGDWYQVAAGQPHAARFETDTAEIEFWFDAAAGKP